MSIGVGCCLFYVVLSMRPMLLALDGKECRQRVAAMTTRIHLALGMQFMIFAMTIFNVFGLPSIIAPLINQEFDGAAGCSTSAPTKDFEAYHRCICAEVTPEYISHCNLSAGIGLEGWRRTMSTFTDLYCPVQPAWYPYENVLTACRSYVSWRMESFLMRTGQYVAWVLNVLWALLEYDLLCVAESLRRETDEAESAPGSWIKSLPKTVARFSTVLTAILVMLYACSQIAASSWASMRGPNPHFLGNDLHRLPSIFMLTMVFIATISASFDALRERASRLLGTGKLRQREHYDVFLTHNWGPDALGRDNHARVMQFNTQLRERGYVTWFDEDRMYGNIIQQMAQGVENSRAVIVFITEQYVAKVAGKSAKGQDDNCKFEFQYACQRLGVSAMVPVVMEPAMRDGKRWSGPVSMTLGSHLYVDASDGGEQTEAISVTRICEQLTKLGVSPSDLHVGTHSRRRWSGYSVRSDKL